MSTVLASWTWLAEETRGDEGAAKLQEGQMDVSPVLVADLQAPEAVEPGERQRIGQERFRDGTLLHGSYSASPAAYATVS
jgi:hypothetical protein